MKTNIRERLTRYRCFIRPKVHFAPEFSFNNADPGCFMKGCICKPDKLFNPMVVFMHFQLKNVTSLMRWQIFILILFYYTQN